MIRMTLRFNDIAATEGMRGIRPLMRNVGVACRGVASAYLISTALRERMPVEFPLLLHLRDI